MPLAKLSPFWHYFGGKFKNTPRYPKPAYPTIIEPFAGAAGYSMRYHNRNVILVEKYDKVAEMWRWLIGASPDDVLAIPIVTDTDDLPSWVPRGAHTMVGFLMQATSHHPAKKMTGWLLQGDRGPLNAGWNEHRRALNASMVSFIKHWRVIEGDYSDAPSERATWFIDPPYQVAGTHYACGADEIDFAQLGAWCRSRPGQVIVCENDGATWLPFRPLHTLIGHTHNPSVESIWTALNL